MLTILQKHGKACACLLALLANNHPAFGQHWVARTVPEEDAQGWFFNSIASSASGQIMLAGAGNVGNGPIYLSTNYGYQWFATGAPTEDWYTVAVSSNGQTLAATDQPDGVTGVGSLFVSTNGGTNWNAVYASVTTPPFSFAMSGDGNKFAVVTASDLNGPNPFGVYLSNDGGNTFTPLTGDGLPVGAQAELITCSGDATRLAVIGAAAGVNAIYSSVDSGDTWQVTSAPNLPWNCITYSANGSNLVATSEFPSGIYISTNAGLTWQAQAGAPANAQWDAIASSADGKRLVAGDQAVGGLIYTSLDGGASWQATNGAPTLFNGQGVGWIGAACSADGKRIAALPQAVSGIYTLDPLPAAAGHVYCACDSNAIAGATVQLGTNLFICDSNGFYLGTNIQPNYYEATISAEGYGTLETNAIVDGAQPIVTNDFYLTNSAVLIIHPIFMPALRGLADAAAISNTITADCLLYTNYLTNVFCAKIEFEDISALGPDDSGSLGTSVTELWAIPYSQYQADLLANDNLSAYDQAAYSLLPAPPNTGINGNKRVYCPAPLLEVLGEHALAVAARAHGADNVDSRIYFNFSKHNITRPIATNSPLYDLDSTVWHEVNEVLGIGGNGSSMGPQQPPCRRLPTGSARWTSTAT